MVHGENLPFRIKRKLLNKRRIIFNTLVLNYNLQYNEKYLVKHKWNKKDYLKSAYTQ